MNLFERNGNLIDIYSFEGDKEALIEYRKKILSNMNIYDMFYSFETTNETIKDRFLKADELDIRFLEHNDIERIDCNWWSELKREEIDSFSKKTVCEELIRSYINGDYSKVAPTRTFIPEDGLDISINNFLVTKKPYKFFSNEKLFYRFENIIDLPGNLCALQLLETGNFSQLVNSWLVFSEQLKLFKIKQISSIKTEDMRNMYNSGLLEGKYEDAMNRIATTQRILSKTRK